MLASIGVIMGVSTFIVTFKISNDLEIINQIAYVKTPQQEEVIE